MKSIERRFNRVSQRNPHWSTIICFAEAIENQKFSRQSIAKWFNRLVDVNDYDKADKKTIIRQMCVISNTFEEGSK